MGEFMTRPPTLRLDHIQLAIPKGSEYDARAFWIGLLGLPELPKPEGLQGRGGLWLQGPGYELHLGVEDSFRPAKKAHPAFATHDLDALAEKLNTAGHPVRWDDAIAGRRRFFSEDPAGNRLEFIGE